MDKHDFVTRMIEKEYLDLGYKLDDPKKYKSVLGGYVPDMVAVSGNEILIIEVKERFDRRAMERMDKIAKAVTDAKFKMVLRAYAPDIFDDEEVSEEGYLPDKNYLLEEIKNMEALATRNWGDARLIKNFLYASVLCEGALRSVARENGCEQIIGRGISEVLRWLEHKDLITRSAGSLFSSLLFIRFKMENGIFSETPVNDLVRRCLVLSRKMLERGNRTGLPAPLNR